ncbi:hypothetical protein [Hydrogenophaga flava]|uniref:hypothetical protein n=1 Tax=Hydrogenophaga flava TaxID=65657 RepID=UPI0008259FA2|nr:hypothetical protein [Hydrogenophaga flava]
MNRIASSALLNLIEQTGLDVATLAEGLDEADLRRSRLTRAELLRHLRVLARGAIGVPPSVREDMPELYWEGWRLLALRLQAETGEDLDEAIWFAIHSVVPATLLWLRVYRQSQPQLFSMTSV